MNNLKKNNINLKDWTGIQKSDGCNSTFLTLQRIGFYFSPPPLNIFF